MDVTVKSIGALERSMRVELPIEPIEQQVDSRLKSVGRTAKIKGFRPGKVPAKIVKQRYGKQVRQEVLGEVLQKSFSAAVTQEKLNPVGGPKIETEDENGKTFAFTATFEIMPEFELKDIEKIEIERPDITICDDDIDDMLTKLRKQKATWDVVDRSAVEGDRVVIDFLGTLKGVAFPGGEAKDFSVELGSGHMLPDFEKGLQGAKAGDEKTFKVKFPKDYHAEDLAGNKADFAITVHRVEAEILPELDDDFATMFDVSEGGLKQFTADVRENMEREAGQKAKSEVREQVMQALLEANPLEIPQALKHQEMHSLQREAMQRMGLDAAQQEAMPLENFSAAAEKRVALGLLLRQVISDKALTIDKTMLRARVEELCAGYENADDMVEMYLSNPQVMQQIEPMVIEQQAIDWILENCKVRPKKIPFEEFMNAPAS